MGAGQGILNKLLCKGGFNRINRMVCSLQKVQFQNVLKLTMFHIFYRTKIPPAQPTGFPLAGNSGRVANITLVESKPLGFEGAENFPPFRETNRKPEIGHPKLFHMVKWNLLKAQKPGEVLDEIVGHCLISMSDVFGH